MTALPTRFHREIADTARKMLDGRTTFIEGARHILYLWAAAGLDSLDPDILPITAVDSETDALPFGEVRKHWAPDALAKLQPDIEHAETWARNFASDPCRKLIERFGS